MAARFRHSRILIASILISMMGTTEGKDKRSRTKKCVNGFELSFHKRKQSFSNAAKSCSKNGGYLVKVNSTVISDAINQVIRRSAYYIGLKWESNRWKWRDRTTAPQRGQRGYQNWRKDEPNGRGENCVIVNNKNQKKWSDITCWRSYFYICQKKIKLVNTVNHDTLVIPEERTNKLSCAAKSTGCERHPSMAWYREGKIWSNSNHLNLRVSNISNRGTYTCLASADGLKVTKHVRVYVDGTPVIKELRSITCDPDIVIVWRAHSLALGFLHKVKAFSNDNPSSEVVHNVTPRSVDQVFEMESTFPSTNYTFEISACLDVNDCPNVYTTRASTITNGIPNPARQAEFHSSDFLCTVSWLEPGTIGDQIDGYEVTLSQDLVSSRVGTSFKTTIVNTTTTSYAFNPLPNHDYSASVKAIACAGKSSAMKASGSCRGLPQAPAKLATPAVSLGLNNSRNLTLTIPSEEGGLMSCLLVVVSNGILARNDTENASPYKDSSFEVAQILEEHEDEYIAVAIPPPAFAFKTELIVPLGDNTTTFCHLRETKHNISSPNATEHRANETICAENKHLNERRTYRVRMVAVVPSGNKLLLATSSYSLLQPLQSSTQPPTFQLQRHKVRFSLD